MYDVMFIKKRGEQYNSEYTGVECSISRGVRSGTYIVSAKDCVQKFQDYCANDKLPTFTPGSDTYVVPVRAGGAIEKHDYQRLIDGGCRICILITCAGEDDIEIKKCKSDGTLLIDYTAKAEHNPFCDGLVYLCASLGHGAEIVFEQETFDLFCNAHARRGMDTGRSEAYLQIGSYGNIRLEGTKIVETYLGINGQDRKKRFLQKLQKEINSCIREQGWAENKFRYLFLRPDRLKEIAGEGRVATMMQGFADSPVSGRVGKLVCGCLCGVTLCVGVKYAYDMSQSNSVNDSIIFGVMCGVCILSGLALCAMVVVGCKFSRPSNEIMAKDVANVSVLNVDLRTE